MLHGGTVRLHCLHVLVQDGENLIVEDLILPDAICHLLQGLPGKTEQKRSLCDAIKNCAQLCEFLQQF